MKRMFIAIMFACASFVQAMMTDVDFVIPYVPERNLILLVKKLEHDFLIPLNKEDQRRYTQNLIHDTNFEFIYKEHEQKKYRFLPVQYFDISKEHTVYVPYSSLEWVPLYKLMDINNPAFQEDLCKRVSADVKKLLHMEAIKQHLEKQKTSAKEIEKKLKIELPSSVNSLPSSVNSLPSSENFSSKKSSSGFFTQQTKSFVAGVGILALGAYVLYNNPVSIIESVKSFVTSWWEKA